MAGISTDATGITSLQSGLETPDVALNLRKQGDSIVSVARTSSCAFDARACRTQPHTHTRVASQQVVCFPHASLVCGSYGARG